MKLAGIDYSMTSPSICVFDSEGPWDVKSCTLHYMVKDDKKLYTKGLVRGHLYPKHKGDQERFDALGRWSADLTKDCVIVGLEGYAFGAVGRVFQIAENTGTLKQKLWENATPFEVFTPTTIKKFATGKGNSDKQGMFDAFKEETGIDMFDTLSLKSRKNWNPVSDIIDAYYIAKLMHTKIFS